MHIKPLLNAERIIQDIQHQTGKESSLTARDLLLEIKAQKPQSSDVQPSQPQTIPDLLNLAEAEQQGLWTQPVIGHSQAIKKVVNALTFFLLHRVYRINEYLIKSVSQLHQQFVQEQHVQHSQIERLYTQIDRLLALTTGSVLNAQPAPLPEHIMALPSLLGRAERLILYSLVYTRKPNVVLEISSQAGPARELVSHALNTNQIGQLYSIELVPQAPHWEQILPNVTVYKGPLDDFPRSLETRSVPQFDFVLIDYLRQSGEVLECVLKILPMCTSRADILVHNSFAPAVNDALKELVEQALVFDRGDLTANSGAKLGGLRWLSPRSG